jgi:hypothetical protein
MATAVSLPATGNPSGTRRFAILGNSAYVIGSSEEGLLIESYTLPNT